MTETFFGLVSTYGVAVIALSAYFSCLAVPVPTFAVMLAGGAFAATGDLSLTQVLAGAYLAAIAGDQTGFLLGRWGGSRLIESFANKGQKAKLVGRARETVDRWGGLGVFFSTWLVAPLGPWVNFVAGATGLGWPRFMFWDALGEAIWVTGYVLLGYNFASQLDALAELIGNWGGLVSSGALVILLGALLIQRQRRRRRA